MDQAAEGFFRFMLGKRVDTIIASAFADPGHTLSYECVTFAVLGDELVGMTCAFTGAQQRGFSDKPLERAAGRAALRLKCTGLLLRPMFRVLSSVEDDDFYLMGIAVDPEMRSKGVGSVLLADVEQRAQSSGSSRLCLDVAAANTRARALYERRGMNQTSQWPNVRIFSPMFVRMTKAVERG